jgi:hypothetical protein
MSQPTEPFFKQQQTIHGIVNQLTTCIIILIYLLVTATEKQLMCSQLKNVSLKFLLGLLEPRVIPLSIKPSFSC